MCYCVTRNAVVYKGGIIKGVTKVAGMVEQKNRGVRSWLFGRSRKCGGGN